MCTDSRTHCFWTLILMCAACALGCSSNDPAEASGAASVGVSVSALSAADVDKVTVTVTGPDISQPIQRNLHRVHGRWQGIIGAIPAGHGRVFHAFAYDSSGIPIYQGQTEDVTISDGQKVAVLILLQQSTPPDPFNNTVPFIDSLVASANAVAPGDVVNLSVIAYDVDPGDSLTYAWSSPGGTFDDATSTEPTWTAPTTEGDFGLSVTVADLAGGTRTVTMTVEVRSHHGRGTAAVEAQFNTWPVITIVLADPGQVDAAETTSLSVVAFDDDNDPLNYAWTDDGGDCAGLFTAPTDPDTSWTAPSSLPPSAACTLQVDVDDGRGGVNTGTITVGVAPPDSFNVAPVVDSTYQSGEQVLPGERVFLGVVAHDPEGAALSFMWSSAEGALENQVDAPSTSDVEWLAPSTDGIYVVTATVADGQSSTTLDFEIEVSSGGADGWLAYFADDSGTMELWVARDNGTNPVRLTEGLLAGYGRLSAPTFSRDGAQIAIQRWSNSDSGEGVVINSDGSNLRVIPDSYDGHSWTSDNEHLVYACGSDCAKNLCRVNVNTGTSTTILTADVPHYPTINPTDDNDIVYTHRPCASSGFLQRVILPGAPNAVVGVGIPWQDIAWTDDGTRLVLEDHVTSYHTIYVYDVQAASQSLLYADPQGYRLTAVIPGNDDSRVYAIRGNASNEFDAVVVIDMATGALADTLSLFTHPGGDYLGLDWGRLDLDIDRDNDGLGNGIDPTPDG